jgi:2,4-dienoyl-CoA reductase-like NADH-dependent reductase (Old Yellow Enzyme family)
MMSSLFASTALRQLKLSNRVAISPMCQYVAEEGRATPWHLIHYGGLASSGAGLLFIEATAVEPDGRITPGDLGLWDDVTEAALKPVIDAIHQYSSTAVILQLGHAGRKASSKVPWKAASRSCRRMADGARMRHRHGPRSTAKCCRWRWTGPAWRAYAMPSWHPRGVPCGWAWAAWNCMARMATCCINSSLRLRTSAATSTAAR